MNEVINPYQIGKDFEKEAFEYLNTIYDEVIWHSSNNWHSPIDFECYKDNKKYMIDAKSSKSRCLKVATKPIDMYLTKVKGEFKFFKPSMIKSINLEEAKTKLVLFDMSEKADKKVKLFMINNSINDKRIAINKILESS